MTGKNDYASIKDPTQSFHKEISTGSETQM
jgi:hypothetical protein